MLSPSLSLKRAGQLVMLLLFSFSVISLELDTKLLKFIQKRFGDQALERLHQWETLSNQKKSLPILQKLDQVNHFFNRAKFVSDQEHWGKEDYWATPVELLATNGGDCEDYSIAKYFTLREMGVPDENLRITYVKALKLDQAHMVLAYYSTPDAVPLILDNLMNDIKPATQRNDLQPVYNFNGEGLWLSKLRGQEGKRIGSSSKLKSWQSLIERQHNLMFR